MPSTTSRLRRAFGVLATVALATAAMTGTASAHDRGGRHHPQPHYYVSLGDSLAAGYQPNVRTNTDVSYTDQLYTQLKKQDPTLVHVKLGCSGETTETMIAGGICSYPGATSQLGAAEAFLRAHRGQVEYVTLDIGANDVDGCLSATGIDQACTAKGIATVATQLPQIASGLRRAGGQGWGAPQYAGMNYYDPFLAVWLTGATGQAEAQQSTVLSDTLNGVIEQGLRKSGFRLADVAKAFSTDDFTDQATLPVFGTVPLNVARICAWTWECTQYQDIHANPTGHAVIAGVFEKVLRRR